MGRWRTIEKWRTTDNAARPPETTHLALKTLELVLDLMPGAVAELPARVRRDHSVCVAGLDESAGRAQCAGHLARACDGAKVLLCQAEREQRAQSDHACESSQDHAEGDAEHEASREETRQGEVGARQGRRSVDKARPGRAAHGSARSTTWGSAPCWCVGDGGRSKHSR